MSKSVNMPLELVANICGKESRLLCKSSERYYMHNADYRIDSPLWYDWLMNIPNINLILEGITTIPIEVYQLSLRKLHILGPAFYNREDRLAFADQMKNLSHLTNFTFIVGSSAYYITTTPLCLAHLINLVKLKFGCIVTEEIPSQIFNMTKLEKLDLWQMYPNDITSLARLPNLKKIVLDGRKKIINVHPSQKHIVKYIKRR